MLGRRLSARPGQTVEMGRCVSPAGTSPPPRPFSVFLPCLWGMRWFFPLPTATPAHRAPLPPLSPTGGKGREEGWGGQGSPSNAAQSISL